MGTKCIWMVIDDQIILWGGRRAYLVSVITNESITTWKTSFFNFSQLLFIPVIFLTPGDMPLLTYRSISFPHFFHGHFKIFEFWFFFFIYIYKRLVFKYIVRFSSCFPGSLPLIFPLCHDEDISPTCSYTGWWVSSFLSKKIYSVIKRLLLEHLLMQCPHLKTLPHITYL